MALKFSLALAPEPAAVGDSCVVVMVLSFGFVGQSPVEDAADVGRG